MKTPLRKKLWFQAAMWFLFALALRLLHLHFVAPSPLTQFPTSDELEHWQLANYLARVDWLGTPFGPYFRPALFAYVLAVLIRLTGGSIVLIHIVIAAMDALAVPLLWLAARRLFTRRAARWGALACALYWPFVHFSATLYMESFALLLQAGVLLLAAKAIRTLSGVKRSGRGRPRSQLFRISLLGLLCGLMLLTRPTFALAFPWLLVCLVLVARRSGAPLLRAPRFILRAWQACAPALLCAAFAVVALVPNAWRNHHVSGQWFWLGGNGAVNFYFANNDRGFSWETVTPGLPWRLFTDLPEVEAGIGPSFAARTAWWQRQFLTYAATNPTHFLGGLYQRALLVWNARAIHCTANFAALAALSPLQRALPGFGILGPPALAGLLLILLRVCRPSLAASRLAQSRRWGQRFLIGYVLIYLACVALLHVIERHRMPALAPLFLFSGVLIEETLAALRRRQRRLVLAGLAAAALAALFINLPLADPALAEHERFWSEVNLGTACRALGRAPEAERHFLAAHALKPAALEPINQLVLLDEDKLGRPADALRWHDLLLRHLRRHWPRHTRLLIDELAHAVHLALAARQPAAAVRAAGDLSAAAPRNPQAWIFLATALRAAGQPAPARDALRQALTLDPANADAQRLQKEIGDSKQIKN